MGRARHLGEAVPGAC
jgi:transposase